MAVVGTSVGAAKADSCRIETTLEPHHQDPQPRNMRELVRPRDPGRQEPADSRRDHSPGHGHQQKADMSGIGAGLETHRRDELQSAHE